MTHLLKKRLHTSLILTTLLVSVILTSPAAFAYQYYPTENINNIPRRTLGLQETVATYGNGSNFFGRAYTEDFTYIVEAENDDDEDERYQFTASNILSNTQISLLTDDENNINGEWVYFAIPEYRIVVEGATSGESIQIIMSFQMCGQGRAQQVASISSGGGFSQRNRFEVSLDVCTGKVFGTPHGDTYSQWANIGSEPDGYERRLWGAYPYHAGTNTGLWGRVRDVDSTDGSFIDGQTRDTYYTSAGIDYAYIHNQETRNSARSSEWGGINVRNYKSWQLDMYQNGTNTFYLNTSSDCARRGDHIGTSNYNPIPWDSSNSYYDDVTHSWCVSNNVMPARLIQEAKYYYYRGSFLGGFGSRNFYEDIDWDIFEVNTVLSRLRSIDGATYDRVSIIPVLDDGIATGSEQGVLNYSLVNINLDELPVDIQTEIEDLQEGLTDETARQNAGVFEKLFTLDTAHKNKLDNFIEENSLTRRLPFAFFYKPYEIIRDATRGELDDEAEDIAFH